MSSTDPGAGASATWTPKVMDTYGPHDDDPLGGVACPSSSLCVAVDAAGNVFTSTDPGAGASASWAREQVASLNEGPDQSGAAISCPSISLCVAVDPSGIATTTNPGDGASATWTPANATYTGSPVGGDDVSCPSISLCVIAGYSDPNVGDYDVVTSTDPGDGASATWTVKRSVEVTSIPGEGGPLLSCPSVSLCVAIANAEEKQGVYTSTDPGAGALATWTLDRAVFGNAVSCPTATLCVLVGPGPTVGGSVAFGTAGGVSPPPGGKLSGKPRLTGLKITPGSFGPRHRAMVSCRDSLAGTISFRVLKRAIGVGVGRTVERFRRRARAGKNSFEISSGGGTLQPGRYRLLATPDSNGVVGASVSVTFKVV